MSVLIKGMEMPKDCKNCPVLCDYSCRVLQLEPEWGKSGRDYRCPLVPVPPHGDLIDRDALRASIRESIEECHKWAEEVEGGEMYARVSQALGTFVECSLRVKAAPTIIPADEGET